MFISNASAAVALHLPGKAMHVRALCGGLKSIRSSLLYIKSMLEDEDIRWELVQDTVARELTMSTMLLGGLLDGCVIAELPSRPNDFPAVPTSSMSFQTTMFQDDLLRNIQADVLSLRFFNQQSAVECIDAVQEVQASLWTVINFWKHFLPYQPRALYIERGRRHARRDFQLVLCANKMLLSGPVVHDLLIPAYNAACRITHRLLEMYKVDGDHSVPLIDM
eukprot:gene28523-biopygen32448